MKASAGGGSDNLNQLTIKELLERWEKEDREPEAAKIALQLGLRYKEGDSDEDWGNAIDYVKKAANLGNRDAQYELGRLYKRGKRKGQISIEDHQLATKWFLKAAERGHAEAQYELGCYYLNPADFKYNLQKAHSWFNEALRHNNPSINKRVNCVLGMHYAFLAVHKLREKKEIEHAYQAAAHFSLAAAKMGDRESAVRLGMFFVLKQPWVERMINPRQVMMQPWVESIINPKRVIKFLEDVVDDTQTKDFFERIEKLTAEQIENQVLRSLDNKMLQYLENGLLAYSLLGQFYESGIGVEVDFEKALAFFKKNEKLLSLPLPPDMVGMTIGITQDDILRVEKELKEEQEKNQAQGKRSSASGSDAPDEPSSRRKPNR